MIIGELMTTWVRVDQNARFLLCITNDSYASQDLMPLRIKKLFRMLFMSTCPKEIRFAQPQARMAMNICLEICFTGRTTSSSLMRINVSYLLKLLRHSHSACSKYNNNRFETRKIRTDSFVVSCALRPQ